MRITKTNMENGSEFPLERKLCSNESSVTRHTQQTNAYKISGTQDIVYSIVKTTIIGQDEAQRKDERMKYGLKCVIRLRFTT